MIGFSYMQKAKVPVVPWGGSAARVVRGTKHNNNPRYLQYNYSKFVSQLKDHPHFLAFISHK